ncbi:unnamed protein product, partial [Ilex paraguariensis]
MCSRVECKQCGKTSWRGCGKHLTTLFAGIEKGKHCMCRPWPGVVVSSEMVTEQPLEGSTSTDK